MTNGYLQILLLFALFPATILSQVPAQDLPSTNGDPNFLYVGNSYQNELARVFKAILEDGIPEWKDLVFAKSIQQERRTLGGHLMDADGTNGDLEPLRQYLVTNPEPWGWVTLQDQSQVPGFYQWDWQGTEYWRSTQAAIQLTNYIEGTGVQTMFLLTWGRRDGDEENEGIFPDFLSMQAKLEEGYNRHQLATSSDDYPTYIAPAGLVFRTIYNDEAKVGVDPVQPGSHFWSLYAVDGSHPSIGGTYAVALTIFTSMYGLDPERINWFPEGLDETTGRLIQDAVSRMILQTFQNGEIDYPWIEPFPERTISTPTSKPPTTLAPTTQAPSTRAPVTESPTTAAPVVTPVPTTKPPSTSVPTPKAPHCEASYHKASHITIIVVLWRWELQQQSKDGLRHDNNPV